MRRGRFRSIENKKGSSAVLTAMIFVAFAICVTSAIGICRELTIKSECEAFGRVWTKAILSEYDLPLMEDYGIMAYFGNDSEVSDKVEYYMDYSTADRLGIDIGGAKADLTGYELGDPDNFLEAMKKGLTGRIIGDIAFGGGRSKRSEIIGSDYIGSEDGETAGGGGRTIGNKVVLDTLPSGGMGGSISLEGIVSKAKALGSSEGIRGAISAAGSEVIFIEKHFDNAVTYASDKESLFRNEWEYVINGSSSDDENLRVVKRNVFLMRNALNLVSLYKDPQKVQLILQVAESITPGPLGLLTQIVIAEAWAALETETDMRELLDNERVPIIKGPAEWKTGLGAVLDSDKVRKDLDDESKELLNEKRDEINALDGISDKVSVLRDGLNYDEHLMIMILAMDERVRLLRIMDLVQINMKFRYYRDFNMMEYYVGTRFSIEANGRSYEFEDSYK